VLCASKNAINSGKHSTMIARKTKEKHMDMTPELRIKQAEAIIRETLQDLIENVPMSEISVYLNKCYDLSSSQVIAIEKVTIYNKQI